MAIVLETEGSILSIQIQLKPISYAYINATQINVLISNEIKCKYNTNTCIQLKCHTKEGVKVGHQVKVSRVQQPPINAICIYIYVLPVFQFLCWKSLCQKSNNAQCPQRGVRWGVSGFQLRKWVHLSILLFC